MNNINMNTFNHTEVFSKKKRFFYFLMLCIPLRIILAVIPLYINIDFLPYYSIVLFLISIGFLYNYFNNSRLHAPEGGGYTWWFEYRLIHGLLYMLSFIYALNKKRIASIPLFIDVIVGIVLFILNHKK